MASTQAVWGIDLGRCALKALKLRAAADGNVEIVGRDYIEHAKILSQPDADRGELIASALEKFLSRNDISKDQVVVGVPGQHTLARFTKLPPVAPKRIPDIVKYEADQQIPFDMDEVIWDFQTFQQEGMPDLEVGIFAMKRELIREHLLHFEQASIEPVAVQCGPLAVYNAGVFDEMLGDETTILIDIGAANTDLVIATPTSFWTRTVPIGGNNFTEALVKSFKLSFAKAEALKRTAATSKYARQIFQAMRPIFADLVQELQRSMGFYSSTHRDTSIEKVVCMGNACKLPGLQKYLQQNLGLPVERPESFNKAKPIGGSDDEEFKDQLLSYGTAYGLALQGLDLATVTSNLLPTEIAKNVVWKKKKPTFAAAAACLVLASGLVWFRQTADMGALAAQSEATAPGPDKPEEAWDIIANGPDRSLPERAQARAILSASDVLKRKLSELEGQGTTERSQTEDLIALQILKKHVPRILQAVHASVPIPEGPLGQATTQAEVLQAIADGAAPRARRNVVYIDRLDMDFQVNLNDVIWENRVSSEYDEIEDPDADLPGIKLKITCRSPHEDRQGFISGVFMKKLYENGRQSGKGFYFNRVFLFAGQPAEPNVPAAPDLAGAAPAGGQGGFGGAAQPTVGASGERYLDPVTNESISDDWLYEIWIDAIDKDWDEVAPAEEGVVEEDEGE